MNKTETLVLSIVDKDIAENFKNAEEGSFALRLPLQIHMCRYLKKISEQLAFIHEKDSSNGTN